MSFFDELKRRNVFRVAIAYIVIAWLLLQVGDTLAPALLLPGWISSALAFFLILGFPVAIFFAWAFELTPEGVKREGSIDQGQSIKRFSGRKMDRAIMLLLAVALGYFVFDKFVLSPDKNQLIRDQATGEQATVDADSIVTVDKNSIAVLPFVNMSSDPEQEYFSDGLTEELLNLLAKIPELRVTSRSSAFAFKGQAISIPEVAAKLRVANILEGSVRKSGNRIRVTAQLIDASSDVHLWSETYDRELDDIFAIQDDISAAVVEALQLTLLGQVPKSRKISTEALDLNMQARYFWHRRGEGDIERARDYYQRALEIDPKNAPAWAGLAVIYLELKKNGVIPEEEGNGLFKQAALNAVAADPDYPEGHIRLAWSYASDKDDEAAQKERDIAYKLDPDNHLVIFDRAVQLQFQGRLEEAIVLHEKAAAQDPLSAIGQINLASFYLWTGRLEEAEVSADRARELSPDMASLDITLADILIAQGRMDEALRLALTLPSGNRRQAYLAIIYFALGDEQQSDTAFAEIVPDGARIPHVAYQLPVHAYRGELEAAFALMKSGIEKKQHFTTFLYDPFLKNMHTDPRWGALLQQAGYDPDA